MKRHFIKHKEFEEILRKLPESIVNILLETISKKSRIEKIELENIEIYILDEKPMLFKNKEIICPLLTYSKILDTLPKIFIDKGAISHICNGADLMKPGVTEIKNNFQPQSIVVIADERHRKPLAIGIALYSDAEIIQMKTGKIAKNIHFIGDKVWKILNSLNA